MSIVAVTGGPALMTETPIVGSGGNNAAVDDGSTICVYISCVYMCVYIYICTHGVTGEGDLYVI